MPCIIIGYKDNDIKSNKIKKDISIEILGDLLFGKSSETFEELYESGKILSEPSINYEFSKTYAHTLIQVQTNYVDEVIKVIDEKIEKMKQTGINEEDFNRAKKKIYGEFIKDYNEVSTISSIIVADYFKNINSFDYFEEFKVVSKEYVEKVLKEIFVEDRKVISVIKPISK